MRLIQDTGKSGNITSDSEDCTLLLHESQLFVTGDGDIMPA